MVIEGMSYYTIENELEPGVTMMQEEFYKGVK